MTNTNVHNTRKKILNQEAGDSDTKAGLHPADIKAALEKKGLNLTQLSRRCGYHPTAAGRALREPWPAVEQIIGEAIGLAPKDIWPDRYDDNGVPLKYQPRRNGHRKSGFKLKGETHS